MPESGQGGHVLRACLSSQELATRRSGARPRSKKKWGILKKSKSLLEGQSLGRGGRMPGHHCRGWAASPGPAGHWTGLDAGGGRVKEPGREGPRAAVC